MDCSSPNSIYENNQGTIAMSKNSILHKRTKHIDINFQYIREKIQDKTIEVKYCPTHEIVADIFTKPLIYRKGGLKIFEQYLDLP